MPPKAVIVTITFSKSPNDLRFQLALKTCDAEKAAGYPLIIVDGSPEESMRDLLRAHGATVFKEEGHGMGASRRQAFKAGLDTGADVIVSTEPEKCSLPPLLGPCIEMVRSGIDIVIPGRMKLDSLPLYQAFSELQTNHELGRITGRYELDLMFGPRVMSRFGTGLFFKYIGEPGEDNWEILFVPVLWMLMKNLGAVSSVLVDYVHPAEQTAAEEGDRVMDEKRRTQRRVLVDIMSRFATEWQRR